MIGRPGETFVARCLAQLAESPSRDGPEQHQYRPDRDPCWRVSPLYYPDGTNVNKQAQFIHGVELLRKAYKLSGQSSAVGVWDGGHALANHLEFGTRVALKDRQDGKSVFVDGHATHVAGTIAAAGRAEKAQGMAPSAPLHSYHWYDDTAAVLGSANEIGIGVTNHSYGAVGGWTIDPATTTCPVWYWFGRDADEDSVRYGRYDSNAAAFDAAAFSNPKLSMFVAAGNERGWIGEPDRLPKDRFNGQHCVRKNGKWELSKKKRAQNSRKDGYDTLVGHSVSKNVITVGAMIDLATNWKRRDIATTEFSSFGPSDDGRIKPDVIANGEMLYSTAPPKRCETFGNCKLNSIDASERKGYVERSGTSMASPVAAGIATLLNELAARVLKRPLYSDEMKAVLIHSALSTRDDEGPTYQAGWGVIQALPAGHLVAKHRGVLQRITVKKGEKTQSIELAWPEDKPARITVVWLDQPGETISEEMAIIDDPKSTLINRIAVTLRSSDSPNPYYPWSLNPKHPEAAPAADRPNEADNVNRFDVPASERRGGRWNLDIDTTALVADYLDVAIAYYGLEPK
jgi:subtilisin family serine protease